MLDSLTTIGQFLLVVIGFGSVIFIHEMGHFLAAKWAGIRVHEFAIGFGKPICAWRQGVGFKIGSTRPGVLPTAIIPEGEGETEYRLNWLPFGGYVKMLGQDDLNPTENSDPDSYTQKPVWKRMVVVSAGVVMNLILAALLFVIVFMVGMPAPSATIGVIRDGSPASQAIAINNDSIEPGLRTGDRVTMVRGRRAMSFADIALAAAMAKGGEPLSITVEREGIESPIAFTMIPKQSEDTHLLELGVASASGVELAPPPKDIEFRIFQQYLLERAGLTEIPAGSRLVSIDSQPVWSGSSLATAFSKSGGVPVSFSMQTPDGELIEQTRSPAPDLQTAVYKDSQGKKQGFNHLLGLRPASVVGACTEHALDQGLRSGDVLARVSDHVWPNIEQTRESISSSAGKNIPVRVLRDGAYVDLDVAIKRDGRVGVYFEASPTNLPPIVVHSPHTEDPIADQALGLTPGTRIVSVGDRAISNFADLRAAIIEAGAAPTELLVRLPIGPDPQAAPTERIAWTITQVDATAVAALGWSSPIEVGLFEPMTTTLKASGPIDALRMGISETNRYVVMTYLTFIRLAQGTVKVEHIKGPVGIAHFGTKIVEQGALSLLFFLAVISANLAVINFLPLPIVDGGLFVFLLVEGITRKPVSVAIQSAATLAGVVLIGAVFLFVTFNDIRTLFGS